MDSALLILRIAMAVIFIFHGYGKLFGDMPGMTGFTKMVANIGFPIPAFFAYEAAFAEFIGGIALLLGTCTRLFAFLIGINMVIALSAVKHFGLPMGDSDLALLAIAIALTLTGPGAYSVSAMIKRKAA